MKSTYLKQIVVLLAASSVAVSALAQYVWLDEHGVKQFSDIAPPSSVPQSRILKQPRRIGGDTPVAAPAAPSGATATDSSASAKAPMTTTEKNADFNKRKLAKAEQDKKAEEEAKRQASQAENCARATSALNSLKSGIRVMTTGSDGQRAYLSDEDRAKQEAQQQSVVDSCK
ncbi:MAG: DUF4124 domain-containing protein [Burkholderiales bacterium]